MPLSIINSIASWFLKQRIHQIELFLKYPNEVQEELLMNLLRSAENTTVGKQYDYGSIKSYAQFVERVPISSYEDLEPLIERTRQGEQNVLWETPIKWFAKSSGTTNAKSKFIPVSNEALEDCHYKGSKDLLCLYLNNNEDSEMFLGKSLRLGGSSQIYENNNTFFGDLSAILIENMPIWAEFSSTPSNKVSLMSEWETKMSAIINETITENVTSFAGVPSWMLVLMNKVLERTGKNRCLRPGFWAGRDRSRQPGADRRRNARDGRLHPDQENQERSAFRGRAGDHAFVAFRDVQSAARSIRWRR